MPRKPCRPPVVCEFFTWRLLYRQGVIYADGRTGKCNLGKHSLGTRNEHEAMANLRILDRSKAIELGLTPPSSPVTTVDLPIPTGWEMFFAHRQASPVLGGVNPHTLKRYKAVRDKHLRFCEQQGIRSWQDINKNNTQQYGNWLHRQDYADRSVYLEVTLVKSVIGWLIDEGALPERCRFQLPLAKPVGTDTYCYSRDEVTAMVRL